MIGSIKAGSFFYIADARAHRPTDHVVAGVAGKGPVITGDLHILTTGSAD
jgi:hypothetical protein